MGLGDGMLQKLGSYRLGLGVATAGLEDVSQQQHLFLVAIQALQHTGKTELGVGLTKNAD